MKVIFVPAKDMETGMVMVFATPFIFNVPVMLYFAPDFATLLETKEIFGCFFESNHSTVCAFLSMMAFPVEMVVTGILRENLHLLISD